MSLDQYYTPPQVASYVANAIDLTKAETCIDPACGGGSLLRAVQAKNPQISIYGIDIDTSAIATLRSSHPDWILSVGDFLDRRSRASTKVLTRLSSFDLVVANPPFSMRGVDWRSTTFSATSRKCSPAMAHILTAAEILTPRIAIVALVPESLMHSHLDAESLSLLSGSYKIQVIRKWKDSTFRGTRASSLLVTFERDGRKPQKALTEQPMQADLSCHVVRGGLPIHRIGSKRPRIGLPLIHSTALSGLPGNLPSLPVVSPLIRGVIQGNALLMPRVGLPPRHMPPPVTFKNPVQLSDCVVSILLSPDQEDEIVTRIEKSWPLLQSLYAGTGAKYTTVKKISEALRMIGIHSSILPGSPPGASFPISNGK
ncbi:N-6 DNA methylase [Corallococcus aberystwythensis]|uniref:SAM-dependent DNA methyltransferase n=1 Tax=Corallococcus aberystwythensis TaxID=2316722 RepID=A0A3A8R560_9BACT|nr:SAM-dependent DNA methyltransferase [Corallococcus aberystwythensis]